MKVETKVLGKEAPAANQVSHRACLIMEVPAEAFIITPASEKALCSPLDTDHTQLFICTRPAPATLPLFYIYDSYLTPAESWANLLMPSGSHSLRDTAYDAVFMALLVERDTSTISSPQGTMARTHTSHPTVPLLAHPARTGKQSKLSATPTT